MLASAVIRAAELLAVLLAAGIYTAVSYLAGNWLQRASGTIDWLLGGAAVIAIVAVWLLVRRQAGRLAERAERAYPGPLESPARRPETAFAPGARRGR